MHEIAMPGKCTTCDNLRSGIYRTRDSPRSNRYPLDFVQNGSQSLLCVRCMGIAILGICATNDNMRTRNSTMGGSMDFSTG